jgi:hypothetical protein
MDEDSDFRRISEAEEIISTTAATKMWFGLRLGDGSLLEKEGKEEKDLTRSRCIDAKV